MRRLNAGELSPAITFTLKYCQHDNENGKIFIALFSVKKGFFSEVGNI
jgi:hypothetical protein